MLDIPFDLETIPADKADHALKKMSENSSGTLPVLLGDANIFSVEWAEIVDKFVSPADVLAEARTIDTESWFSKQGTRTSGDATPTNASKMVDGLFRAAALPIDIVLLPARLASWPLTKKRPAFFSNLASQSQQYGTQIDPGVEMLKTQLAELEAAGEGTEEELNEIRQIIEEIAADGTYLFPDPVAYVTPRHSDEIAAGMLHATEPWEVAAWLQHGTYAVCAPKPVFAAHCKWMWDQFGARIITASTDHVGFEVDHPINDLAVAKEMLHRFQALGAKEVNAEHLGSGGESLVGASRLWVWWD